MTGNLRQRRLDNLNRLLRPRHIAYIGGSQVAGAIAASREAGFAGEIWVVNPQRDEVQGIACCKRIEDLPQAPDAALIALSAERSIESVATLARVGAGGAVCMAAGFAELGPDNALQQQLVDAAGDLAVIGPNCMGVLNLFDGASAWGSGGTVEPAGARGGELTFLTMLTEFRDAQGILLAEERSTTVTTGAAPESDDWEVDVPEYNPDYPENLDPVDPFTSIQRSCWEDVDTGMSCGDIETGPLRIGDIVRFQAVVGEDNPLHYDLAWAKSLGYPNVFGLGSHQASMLAAMAAHWLDPSAVRSFKARFRNVYWPGEVLTYRLLVTNKYRDPVSQQRMLELTLNCTRGDADPVVDAWMTLDFGAQ